MEIIDLHVHLRDEEWSHKCTIELGLRLAKELGIKIVADMPNLPNPVVNERRVLDRLSLVPKEYKEMYRLWIGLTNDLEQVTKAIEVYDNYDEVIGLKMFAGKSIGPLSISEQGDQYRVFSKLTELGYDGPIAVHCEKDSKIKNCFDPKRPITHLHSRPEDAEIESVKDIVKICSDTGFKGIVYFCHISTPTAFKIILDSNINYIIEITPHHFLWDSSKYNNHPEGLLFKVNPPLRDRKSVERLRKLVIENYEKVVYGSDFAPHHITEKLYKPYLSGIPSMFFVHEMIREIEKMSCKSVVETIFYKNQLKLLG